MALIKCPECGKEISEDKESCPMCGFKVKEFNKQAEKEHNKVAKSILYKKVGLVIIAVITIIIVISTIVSNQKLKSF